MKPWTCGVAGCQNQAGAHAFVCRPCMRRHFAGVRPNVGQIGEFNRQNEKRRRLAKAFSIGRHAYWPLPVRTPNMQSIGFDAYSPTGRNWPEPGEYVLDTKSGRTWPHILLPEGYSQHFRLIGNPTTLGSQFFDELRGVPHSDVDLTKGLGSFAGAEASALEFKTLRTWDKSPAQKATDDAFFKRLILGPEIDKATSGPWSPGIWAQLMGRTKRTKPWDGMR